MSERANIIRDQTSDQSARKIMSTNGRVFYKPEAQIEEELIRDAQIRTDNPALHYKVISEIGRGANSKIFKVLKQDDRKHYALKFSEPKNDIERTEQVKEIGIMRSVQSEYLV